MVMVFVLALLVAADPVRIGVALLLISRQRPMRNLLGYWLGALIASSALTVGLLTGLRGFAPAFAEGVNSVAASSTGRHVQIVVGLLVLLLAVLVAVGFPTHLRASVPVPAVGVAPAGLLNPGRPTALSRLLGRARGLLDGPSFRVAFVVGMSGTPPAVEWLVAVAAILASGASIGMQVSAAIGFILVTLAVVEMPLVAYLVKPAQTQVVMLQLHSWVRSRRRQILAVLLAVAGAFAVASGMGAG
ncbi:GAP family protein [Mycobacterium haemophilum]|uniref:Gap protein n=1 Tax=Mycobacterium haemophilum TaxID=29311 RepID=A0A0I9Y0K4_9MYCO|nr:GAP family protein [Mycobacterium haemophilum]AKN18171.1 hypothetical protein B586_18855 [Mycobacterium haemophilum DSM 44634]KLO32997.1 hypothetical protein ABH39_02650 [Mycobacterium haemophilum]KLO37952.1 hypothetical protein ABH38_04905 [Mycobacterium haemophilum]KLO44274.1 hypothetical protein ABH37_03800 [Mycobacterium haemophilum]KLO55179.1 hypothetical protein ABH36_07760 [Mycobacterium haemophilum]